MTPLRVAIIGASGRMGQTLVRLAAADARFHVAAALTVPEDPRLGQDAGHVAGLDPLGVAIGAELTVPCDVALEFSLPAGCVVWARRSAAQRIPFVSGTTGLAEADHAELSAAARHIPLVWAPNMSTGVNLLIALVEDLAQKLDDTWDIEIVETHHRRKIDAPSGTARALLAAACRSRSRTPDEAAVHGRVGEVGARKASEIGMHAVRRGSIVGEHAVHFTSETESLTLEHRAFAREVFAAGALRAAAWIVGWPPGRYGMRDVLGL